MPMFAYDALKVDKEEMLDVFRFDPNFDENELLWEQIKKEILGDDDDEEDEDDGEGEDGEVGGRGNTMLLPLLPIPPLFMFI